MLVEVVYNMPAVASAICFGPLEVTTVKRSAELTSNPRPSVLLRDVTLDSVWNCLVFKGGLSAKVRRIGAVERWHDVVIWREIGDLAEENAQRACAMGKRCMLPEG
jgi:hypothetical protein